MICMYEANHIRHFPCLFIDGYLHHKLENKHNVSSHASAVPILESTRFAHWFTHMPLVYAIMIRSPSDKTKKPPNGDFFVLVDSKGIEPSNLTDANRALSQLSYEPKFELFGLKQGDLASKSMILITFRAIYIL